METDALIMPIEADDSQGTMVMKRFEGSVAATAQRLNKLGNQLSLAVTLPMTIFFAKARSAFLGFDQAMTESTSIMSGVTDEMRADMETAARSIAKTTATSATDAAKAYYFLASAGYSARQSIAALPIVEQFATAGAFDLEKATSLLADAQSALGLSTGSVSDRMIQMTRVSDVLVEAAKNANASVEQFASSLTNKAAANLKMLNKNVEEGVAALMVYADAGIKGEMAGERLSIMLREVQNSSMRQKETWDQLGLAVYDANGRMKSLSDLMVMLEDHTAGMSDEMRVATFQMLGFRSQSLGAVFPLLGMSQKLREYENALRSAGGATDEVASKQMLSFQNQFQIARNRIGLFVSDIGRGLVPSLLLLNQVLARGAMFWLGMDQGLRDVLIHVSMFVAVSGPALKALGFMLSVYSALPRAIVMTSTALGNLVSVAAAAGKALLFTNPVTAGITILAAAVAGLTAYFVGPEGLASGIDYVRNTALHFVQNFSAYLEMMSVNVSIAGAYLVDVMTAAWSKSGEVVAAWVEMSAHNFGVFVNTGVRLLSAFFGWLYRIGTEFWTVVFSDAFITAVYAGINGAFDALGRFASGTLSLLGTMARGAFDLFLGLGAFVLDVFMAIPTAIAKTMLSVGRVISRGIKMILTGQIPDVTAMFSEVMDAAKEDFKAAAATAGEAVDQVVDTVGEKTKDLREQISGDFEAGFDDLNFINTAGDIIEDQMSQLQTGLDVDLGVEAPQFTGVDDFVKDATKIADAAETADGSMRNMTADVNSMMDGMDVLQDGFKNTDQAASTLDASRSAVSVFSADALSRWLKHNETMTAAIAAKANADSEKFTKVAASMQLAQEFGSKVSGTVAASGPLPGVRDPMKNAGRQQPMIRQDPTTERTVDLLSSIENNTRTTTRLVVVEESI